MVEISVATTKDMMDKLNQLRDEYPDEMANAVWLELSKVMNESKKLCPVDTGLLRGSGYVPEPVIGYGVITASLGYSADYAWWVHELVENYHKPPTQAKFLEQPLNEAAPRLVELIIKRVYWLMMSGRGGKSVAREVSKMIEGKGSKWS